MQFGFYSSTHHPAVNQAVGDFVSDLIWDEPGQFENFCTMAVADEDQLVAGVVYHNYQPRSQTIEISSASKRRKWMSRAVIREAIDMPFTVLGCQAVLARHSEDAKHIRHIWNALGAEEYIIPRLRGRNEPAECVAVLTQEAWQTSPFNKTSEKCNGEA